MTWVLLIIYFSGFTGAAAGQSVILQTATQQQCEAARAQLLKLPGYDAKHLLCLEGMAPHAE